MLRVPRIKNPNLLPCGALLFYAAYETFFEVPLFQETSPAPKVSWLRASGVDKKFLRDNQTALYPVLYNVWVILSQVIYRRDYHRFLVRPFFSFTETLRFALFFFFALHRHVNGEGNTNSLFSLQVCLWLNFDSNKISKDIAASWYMWMKKCYICRVTDIICCEKITVFFCYALIKNSTYMRSLI